jgi:hypothetical protein
MKPLYTDDGGNANTFSFEIGFFVWYSGVIAGILPLLAMGGKE